MNAIIKRPVKVLHFARMWGSGLSFVVINYYRNIDKSKVMFDIVSDVNNIFEEEITAGGGKCFTAPNYKSVFRFCAFVHGLLKKREYDIVHIHEIGQIIPVLLIAILNGVKVRIIHSHNSNINGKIKKISMPVQRLLFQALGTRFYGCSVPACEFLFGKGTRYKVINNAVDVNKFAFDLNARNRVRKDLNIADNANVIGHCAGVSPAKNHPFLFKVFAEIKNRIPDAILLCVGEGIRTMYIDLARSLGIEKNVIFYGRSDAVYELYSAMDIFLLPSFYEGLALVAIEAQASGLPAIVSTGVAGECLVTDSAMRLDLSDSVKWIDAILNKLSSPDPLRDRNDKKISELITHAGYNIAVEAKKLEELLLRSLNIAPSMAQY